MCCSGKCSWEGYMGDCTLQPNTKEKFNIHCEMPITCKEEQEYFESEDYKERLKKAHAYQNRRR